MRHLPDSPAMRDVAHAVLAHPVHRAGLRTPPSADAPTGAFAVVEMTILVIVVALAMVSVIVASDDDPARRTVASVPASAISFSAVDAHPWRVVDASRAADTRRVANAR